jgi:hypothetical protein
VAADEEEPGPKCEETDLDEEETDPNSDEIDLN